MSSVLSLHYKIIARVNVNRSFAPFLLHSFIKNWLGGRRVHSLILVFLSISLSLSHSLQTASPLHSD